MTKTTIGYLFLLIVFALPLKSLGQTNMLSCNQLRTGSFYYYPTKSPNQFLIIRNETVQEEINLVTKDTSYWSLDWKKACEVYLKFIRCSKPMTEDELAFFNAHKTVVEIMEVGKEYYVFRGKWTDNVNCFPVLEYLI